MNKLKRYIIFLIGLFVNSLGVSLITKANLGTSPISSIPYVLSLNFPLLIGCVILGFGVYIEVLADVVMLPGESFVRAIVQTLNREFGSTKVCFDVSMAVIAAVLSFVLAHRLDGVREGTVIAALLVIFMIRKSLK